MPRQGRVGAVPDYRFGVRMPSRSGPGRTDRNPKETSLAYTHVDKPISVGAIELKNRIVRPAHGTVIGKGTMGDANSPRFLETAIREAHVASAAV